jgi:imidazolonepropionase-like amidohydrolase
MLRQKGCNICIGTDSPASNDSLSIIEELKCFRGIPLEELLGWATHNGAAALGYGDTLGTIAVGRRCGIVVISGVDFSTMTLTERASARRIL